MANNNVVAVRSNMTPPGGVVNPNPQALGTVQAQDAVTQLLNYQLFTGASERNLTKQETKPLNDGQQVAIQIRNVGFLQSSLLKITLNMTYNSAVGNSTVNFGSICDMFPQIRNICQSALTHNASAYELIALHNKKYDTIPIYANNIESVTPITGNTRSFILGNHGANNGAKEIFINRYISLESDSTSTANVSVSDNKCSFNISFPASTTNAFLYKINLYIPIEFTFSKNSLFGLIPLQSNSVYDEITFTPAYNKLPANIGNITSSAVTLFNETWAVPIAQNAQQLYMPYISYNYLVSSLQDTVTTTGAKAFNYMIKSNMLLTSIILTTRNAQANQLIYNAETFDKVYLDYNGSSFYEDVDVNVSNFYNSLNNRGNNPLPAMTIKDFSQLDRNNNSYTWSNFMDMYQANSPRIVGDIKSDIATIAPQGININVCYESLVPSTVTVIG